MRKSTSNPQEHKTCGRHKPLPFTQDASAGQQTTINLLIARVIGNPADAMAVAELCAVGPDAAPAVIPLLDYPDERVAKLADIVLRRLDQKTDRE